MLVSHFRTTWLILASSDGEPLHFVQGNPQRANTPPSSSLRSALADRIEMH